MVIAGGGSGHGFKMGPAIGSCAAALALGQPPPLPVDMFSIERFNRLKQGARVPSNK